MNTKLQKAIERTIMDSKRVPVSILRFDAEDHDEIMAVHLVKMAELQRWGIQNPTDRTLCKTTGLPEFRIITETIDRTARRR